MRDTLPGFRLVERSDFVTQSGDQGVKTISEGENQSGQRLRFTQYYFYTGARKFVVTFTTLAGESARLDALFDKTLKSFRIGRQ